MLYEVLKHIKNFFPVGEYYANTYKIENGTIALDFMKNNQYFLIEGSTFNDGIHKFPPSEMINEEFVGVVSPLAIPADFLELVGEIEAYESGNKVSPYASESFGGYSYTRATNAKGNPNGWKDVYQSRLDVWRKK